METSSDPPSAGEPSAHRPDGGATRSTGGRVLRRALLWGLLVGVLIALAVAFALHRFARPPIDPLPVLGTIPDFTLTDHTGRTIGRDALIGAPWIGDLVFTRCVLACPLMTTRMSALDRQVPARTEKGTPAARLVSISVDPEHDQPEVLAAFADRYGASDRWLFLTGDRDEIHRLAGEGMHLGFDPNPPLVPLEPGDDIYHSTRFVLVDAAGRVRGYYDSQSAEELERLRDDLDRLLEDPSA